MRIMGLYQSQPVASFNLLKHPVRFLLGFLIGFDSYYVILFLGHCPKPRRRDRIPPNLPPCWESPKSVNLAVRFFTALLVLRRTP
jgi:hypothetical protein